MSFQPVKFYQTGTFTVGNSLLAPEERSVQANMERTNSLNSGHRGCQGCGGCGNLGGGRAEEMYRPYIEGKRELREINESYRANFVRG